MKRENISKWYKLCVGSKLKGEQVKERKREHSPLLRRSISPYTNETLSKIQESVQANGICLSMKRIDTISTENRRGRAGRKRQGERELWEEKKQGETGRQSERA